MVLVSVLPACVVFNKVRAPGLQFVREQSAVFGVFEFFLGPVTSSVVIAKLGSECALTMQTLP